MARPLEILDEDWSEGVDPRYMRALLRQSAETSPAIDNASLLKEEAYRLVQAAVYFRKSVQSVIGNLEMAVSRGYVFDPRSMVVEVDAALNRDKNDKARLIKAVRARQGAAQGADVSAIEGYVSALKKSFEIRYSTQIDLRKRLLALWSPSLDHAQYLMEAAKAYSVAYREAFDLKADLAFRSEVNTDGALLVARLHVGNMPADEYLAREDRALEKVFEGFPQAAGYILIRPVWDGDAS